MKSLLRILSSIAILSTSVTTVISCEKTPYHTSAQSAIDKIKNKQVKLFSSIPTDLKNQTTISAIQKELHQLNPTLKASEIHSFTFAFKSTSVTQLKVGDSEDVIVTSHIGSKTALGEIYVAILDKISSIIKKIKKTDLTPSYISNLDISNKLTKFVIKHALKAANPDLTNTDLQQIQFELASGSKSFIRGIKIKIILVITADGKTDRSTNINFIAESAANLQDKLLTGIKDIYIYDTSAANVITTKQIKYGLQTQFKLSTIELDSLSSFVGDIAPAKPTVVHAKFNDGAGVPAASNIYFNVSTLTLSHLANAIKGTNLTSLPLVNFAVNNNDTKTIINHTFSVKPFNLTPDAIDNLGYNGTESLNTSSPTVVNVDVGNPATIADNANVNMQAISATDLKAKIKTTNLVVATTNLNTTNSNTIDNIRSALLKVNPTLTTDDTVRFTFANKTLSTISPTTTTATITVGSGNKVERTTIDLNIRVAQADETKKKITNLKDIVIPYGTNTSLTNAATIKVLKSALQKTYPDLSDDALNTIAFDSSQSLQPGNTFSLTLTITVDSTAVTTNQDFVLNY